MKLNGRAFAHAAALVWTTLYIFCTLLVAVAPKDAAAAFGYIMHADLTPIVRSISWGGFFAGIVFWYVLVAASVGAAVWLYNRFAYASAAIPGEPKATYNPVVGETVR